MLRTNEWYRSILDLLYRLSNYNFLFSSYSKQWKLRHRVTQALNILRKDWFKQKVCQGFYRNCKEFIHWFGHNYIYDIKPSYPKHWLSLCSFVFNISIKFYNFSHCTLGNPNSRIFLLYDKCCHIFKFISWMFVAYVHTYECLYLISHSANLLNSPTTSIICH